MRPKAARAEAVVTKSVVVWGRPEVGATGTDTAGEDLSYDLLKESTSETLYALRDPELLLKGRVGLPTLVSGPVVGAARGLPLLKVVRAE